jgi:early secretory antigenic target protein ESAT-6
MSGDGVKVDFGAVTSLAGSIDGQANAIDQQLNDLRGQISQLDQLWEGSASSGYQATKKAWFDAATNMQQTLARIATAVHAAADSYTQTEAGNAKLWG